MYQVGIDIGSSAAKTVVLQDGEIWKTMENGNRIFQQENGR